MIQSGGKLGDDVLDIMSRVLEFSAEEKVLITKKNNARFWQFPQTLHTDRGAETGMQRLCTDELKERSFADLWNDYLLTDDARANADADGGR